MVMRFVKGVRGILVPALVAHAAVSLPLVTQADELMVPKDESLTCEKYLDLGVPDPKTEWTANQYEQALRVLGGIRRTQLPRVAGERCPIVFERILITYGREFLLDYKEPPQGASPAPPRPLTLARLYSPSHDDYLLLDRELVAIRSESLARSLRTLSGRSELTSAAHHFAEMLDQADSEAARRRASDGMRRSEDAARHTAELVEQQASELLVLLATPQLGDLARQDALRSLENLLPQVPAFVTEECARRIASLLRGAAGPTFNAAIRPGLLQLADRLEVTHSDG